MEDYANEDIRHLQEELLALMPVWNYRIAKPFKQMLDEGVRIGQIRAYAQTSDDENGGSIDCA